MRVNFKIQHKIKIKSQEMNSKIHLVALIVMIAMMSVPSYQQIDQKYNYDTYYKQFNRTYVDEERTQHEDIFNKKYAEILELRRQGHDAVVNQFTDWNETQLANIINFNGPASGFPISQRPVQTGYVMASPPTFDWRKLNKVTPVKNQGNCGSCWAFAATSVFESQIAILSNGTIFPDLAEQYIVQCTSSTMGCNGGNPYPALILANKTGIPTQLSYPYYPFDGRYYTNLGKKICSDTTGVKLPKPFKIVTYNTTSTVQQLQSDLSTYGPLSVGVKAGQTSFTSTGSTGLISCVDSTSQVDHAITLVGYNTTHWFIKNSWGTGWGDKGYAYINKTVSANCGIYKYIQVPIVNTSANIDNSSNINITIRMTDSKSNGWNGTVIGFTQNDVTVANFGTNFTSGATSGPINVTINGKAYTKIVVTTFGTAAATSQIGFVVTFPNGTVIVNRLPGAAFTSTTVFAVFCALGGCPIPSTQNVYNIYMTDTGCDGWNGTQIGIRQSGMTTYFGLSGGKSYGPWSMNLTVGVLVQMVVFRLGNNSHQVGCKVTSGSGVTMMQLVPGKTLVANQILANFTPGMFNEAPVSILPQTTTLSTQTIMIEYVESKGLLISTIVLSVVVGLLLLGLIFALFKIRKIQSSKKQEDEPNPESAKDIFRVTEVQSNKQTLGSAVYIA